MKRFPVAFFFDRLSWTEEIHANWSRKKNVLVFRQWADLFKFSKFRNVKWTSLFLFGFCTKMIFSNEWSNARNGIYMTKSRTSFNKQLLNYWIFIKGMYHWRGSLCLSSSDGHHEQGKFVRIESEKRYYYLSCVNGQIYISLENLSNGINLEWKF